MYYKVVVKEMKKTTVACDACKKRKGKCSGTSPCTRCAEAGIPCTYLQGNRKRGPVSKKQKAAQYNESACLVDGTSPLFYLGNEKLIVNHRDNTMPRTPAIESRFTEVVENQSDIMEEDQEEDETVVEYKSDMGAQREASRKLGLALASAYYESTLSNTMERNYLVELFMENMTFSDTLDELESLRQRLLAPKTHAQEMKVRAVMGFMARGLGQLARAEQFVSDARTLTSSTMEDPTFDAADAFYALSSYYPLTDYRNSMFLNMAHSITKWIAEQSEQARTLHNFSTVATTILDKSLDASTKRNVLKAHAPTILNKSQKPTLKDLLLAAVVKFYCVLSPVLLDRLHVKRMHELKDVHFSKEEAAQMLEDVSFLDQVLRQHTPQKGIILVLRVTKLLIQWRSGDIEAALKEADATVDWEDFEPYKYFAQIGQFEKARKVYHMFTTISRLYGQQDLEATHPCPAPPQQHALSANITQHTTTIPPKPIVITKPTKPTKPENSSHRLEETSSDMFDVPRLLSLYNNNAPTTSTSEIINIPYVGNNNNTTTTTQHNINNNNTLTIRRTTARPPTPTSPPSSPPTPPTTTTTPMYHTPYNSTYSPPQQYNSVYMHTALSSPNSTPPTTPPTPLYYNTPPTPPSMYTTHPTNFNNPPITPPHLYNYPNNMYSPATTFLSHGITAHFPPTPHSLAHQLPTNFYSGILRDDVNGDMYTLLEDWLMK